MSTSGEPIRITRGRGGEVDVQGPVDGFAAEVLRRAGFEFHPSLRGWWIRLPFDHGRDWENEHAGWAATMLTAARYPVHLDAGLRPTGSGRPAVLSAPRRSPSMRAQAPPGDRQKRH